MSSLSYQGLTVEDSILAKRKLVDVAWEQEKQQATRS